MTNKPEHHEKIIPPRTGLCRSPGAEPGAGSRRVIPEDRVGRPVALSAGSLSAAAAAGEPVACDARRQTSARQQPEPTHTATGAAARVIPPAAGKAVRRIRGCRLLRRLPAPKPPAASARKFSPHHRGGQLYERLLGQCRRQQRPSAALPRFHLRSCRRLLREAGDPRKHSQRQMEFYSPLADPSDLVAAGRGQSEDFLQ